MGNTFSDYEKSYESSLIYKRDLDPVAYSGKWYEIAKTPFKYETHCGNKEGSYSTADYTWENNSLTINNRCFDANGNVFSEAKGKAYLPKDSKILQVKYSRDPTDLYSEDILNTIPGNLEVKFDSFIVNGQQLPYDTEPGSYVVHYTDYDNLAIVGSPEKKNVWILSRTPKISIVMVKPINNKLIDLGYNPDNVIFNSNTVEY